MVWNLYPDWFQFSPFCSSVLFDFNLPAPLMASKIAVWTFLRLDILSLMIWISYKTNMPTWLPLSSAKGSSSWLPWIVFYPFYPYSGAPEKHYAALKPILRGQDLALGHFNQKHFVVLFFTISKLSLHFLQVFWLGSKFKFTERTIWSLNPV